LVNRRYYRDLWDISSGLTVEGCRRIL